MNTDTIADFLTRIRNAQMAGHRVVEIPSSNVKKRMTEILYDQGYIFKYTFEENVIGTQGVIKIALKYDTNNVPVIRALKRSSRPGKRNYSASADIPHVLNGLGIAIVSTSKGIMTDKQARAMNVGGEILCEIY
ncbi:MAG: 30S ribosomal protein S8 [Saprospirales bacterium TMED214]|nr:MAG: 30S ribosomal protein S8 [Saprospirales bacterium TMED214]